MAVGVDMPDTTRLDPMDFSIAHNNGVNCRYLAVPEKHLIEIRVARQKYDIAGAEIDLEGDTFRFTCIPVETSMGNLEMGNPMGSTVKYSILRFEVVLDGETVFIADAMAGLLVWNGAEVTGKVESILS